MLRQSGRLIGEDPVVTRRQLKFAHPADRNGDLIKSLAGRVAARFEETIRGT